jgi:hypothetical protein
MRRILLVAFAAVMGYKVLDPIRHGSLTVFPVVARSLTQRASFSRSMKGLRSGDVVVTEYGNVRGLMRRHTPAIAAQRRAPR